MNLTIAQKRARLTSHIWNYKKRLEAAEVRYSEDKHRLRMIRANTDAKIEKWEKEIRDFDLLKDSKIKELDEKIKEFVGVSVTRIRGKKKIQQAKWLFYRWGLESGIKGKALSLYTGEARQDIPSRRRLYFIRSFSKKPENKQLWENFKLFMKSFED